MKTLCIFLCLGISAGLAQAVTQIKADLDKAVMLYVSSYQYGMADHRHERSDYYDGNVDLWMEIWQDSQHDLQWNDGGGGNAHDLESYKYDRSDMPSPSGWSCELQSSWPATTGPDLVPGTTTEDTCSENVPYEIPAPYLYQEHCVVNDPTNYTVIGDHSFLEVDETYNRTADTKMTLFTGGKGVPGRQNLFQLSAEAWEILDKRAGPPFYYPTPVRSILAQNIQIMGKALGSDGNLYLLLPDNQTLDVTPKVDGRDFYTFTEGRQKYTLTINASGHDLSRETPEFCVGQSVSFVPNWQPQTPPYVDSVQHWSLPGKFVNEPYQYSTWCNSYRLNSDWLTNRTITCWFVNRPGGTASIGMNLKFSNGQTAGIAAKGDFTIFRPTAQITHIDSPRYYTISANLGLTCKLQLGNSSGDGDLAYIARVDSKSSFAGNANITQLVTANYSNPLYVFSDERCDGSEFYNTTPGRVNAYGTTGLNDGPWEIWEHPNIVSLSARDFVRFKPDGGIWVTLGIINWETVGVAEQDILGHWAITEDATTGPGGPDGSDEFPVWTKTVSLH